MKPHGPDIMMDVDGIEGKVSVKAADPLAAPPMPLYYTHSKMLMYNDNFFHFLDRVMSPAFGILCPWFTISSQAALEDLFTLEFEK